MGFRAGSTDIARDPNGHQHGMSGPEVYWQVSDMRQSLQALLDAGATLRQDVRDVGGGLLIASVKDADGNDIGLAQASS